MHFARMVQEANVLAGQRVLGFYYDRERRIGTIDFNLLKFYFDLTHPFVSFFVVPSVKVPCKFEQKDIGISGYTVEKLKHIDGDRVLYILLRRGSVLKALALELTGRSSYFLVIDERGRIIRKYPPYRRRNRGGDIGEMYKFPEKRSNRNVNKYFPETLKVSETELLERFYASNKFYTDGHLVLPFMFEGSKECGEFVNCMFDLYTTLRFKAKKEIAGSEIPYYVFYKAASMIEKGMLELKSDSVEIDGFEIPVPATDRGQVIEYLYQQGRAAKNRNLSFEMKVAGQNKSDKIKSPSGYEVLVGKSAKDNNRITFNLARGNDTFFHVRDYPGAHVILKNHGQPITEEDIIFCARLAKMHSKAKGDTVDVMYTQVKYVRPVPGVPGKVILLKENNVRV